MRMKKKKKKNREPSPMSDLTAPLRSSAKAFNWKLLLIVALNTVIIFGFYRLMLNFLYFEFVMGAYLVLTAGFVFAYVIYNRGFARRNLTREMLPEEWSEEQKVAYVADGERRMQKSKWMLTIIFPLILTFTFDFIELYWGDMFARWFQ
jgi:hypothetical protein